MLGYDFHRQKPLNNYIVDFYCNELMLAIEIDGETHSDKFKVDLIRQKKLESLGINFLRFEDIAVKLDLTGVLDCINEWITRHTPTPSQEGNNSISTQEGNNSISNQEGI